MFILPHEAKDMLGLFCLTLVDDWLKWSHESCHSKYDIMQEKLEDSGLGFRIRVYCTIHTMQTRRQNQLASTKTITLVQWT